MLESEPLLGALFYCSRRGSPTPGLPWSRLVGVAVSYKNVERLGVFASGFVACLTLP